MAELWVLDAKDFAAGASRLVQDALSRTGELTLSLDSEATLKLVARVGEISAETFHKLVQGLVHQLIQKLPTLESDIYYVINVIFTPRAILQQIVAATVLQVGLLSWEQFYVLVRRALNHFSSNGREITLTRKALREAQTYEQWCLAADRLDALEGNDVWRQDPNSTIYDKRILRRHIEDFETLMADGQVFDLMFRLRGGLARNKYGLLHRGLFTRAHGGTKILVAEYQNTVAKVLHFIAEEDTADLSIPLEAKLAFFNEIRHAYGRTALLLSGGAAMGFYHAGVVKALLVQGLLPRVISGASAGSILTALVGVRTNDELIPLFTGETLNLNFFMPHRRTSRKPSIGDPLDAPDAGGGERGAAGPKASFTLFLPPALRWLGDVVLTLFWHNESILKMDTEHFRAVLRHNIGLYTFQEAFDRTGRIINITVSPKNRTDPPRLLNYLTAPHVLVWSAALASSSVPGVFEASPLYVKESDGVVRPETLDGDKFADGSMEADLPMAQLSELFNVNHFVVSQVNPHATLLSTLGLHSGIWQHPVLGLLVGIVRFLKDQIRTWYQHFVELVGRQTSSTQWALRQGLTQLFTQEYEGRDQDVTIWPWRGKEGLISSFVKMLENPSREEFERMVMGGEANTWASVAMIRSHCLIEQEFEKCIQIVRRKLATRNALRDYAAGEPDKMGGLSGRGRVPSFYTSPSLVKLSGLAVSDNVTIPDVRITPTAGRAGEASHPSAASSYASNLEVLAEDVANDSIDHKELQEQIMGGSTSAPALPHKSPELPAVPVNVPVLTNENEVIKTSSMANFYYRRSRSADNLLDGRKTRNMMMS